MLNLIGVDRVCFGCFLRSRRVHSELGSFLRDSLQPFRVICALGRAPARAGDVHDQYATVQLQFRGESRVKHQFKELSSIAFPKVLGQFDNSNTPESQPVPVLQWGSRREPTVASEMRCLFRPTIRAARSPRIPIYEPAVFSQLTAFRCGSNDKRVGRYPSTGKFAAMEAFFALSKTLRSPLKSPCSPFVDTVSTQQFYFPT